MGEELNKRIFDRDKLKESLTWLQEGIKQNKEEKEMNSIIKNLTTDE